MWEQVSEQAISFLGVVLLGVLSLAAAYASYYIQKAAQNVKKKTEQLDDERHANEIHRAVERIKDVALQVVAETEQVSAKAIRDAVKSGQLSRDQLLLLGGHAKKAVIDIISGKTAQLLTDEFDDLGKYIDAVVEAQVLAVKNRTPADSIGTAGGSEE